MIKSRRRILVPLATLLAAGAIAIGSGADFNSSSTNSGNAYTTGTLSQSNDVTGALFSLTNLKPGDSITKNVTITNSGSLPAAFTLTEFPTNNTFPATAVLPATTPDRNLLTLSIKEGTTTVWTGPFAMTGSLGLGSKALASSSTATQPAAWAPLESHIYTFTVKLDQAATNLSQGKSATADYRWDAVQENGASFSGVVTGKSVNTVPGIHNGGLVNLLP